MNRFRSFQNIKVRHLATVLIAFAAIGTPQLASAATIPTKPKASEPDIVLIGGGIMSATLGALLHELDPSLKIQIYERLGNLAFESSGTLNNAGTGHAALAELNYTPRRPDGSVDVSKAIQINEEFEVSKQFWSYLADQGALSRPDQFIRSVPHLSWVHGAKNVEFLKARHEALRKVSLFQDMQYTEDPKLLREWMPVIMQGRKPGESMAATKSLLGTDVDYGRLTTLLFQNLVATGGAEAFVSHDVRKIRRSKSGRWHISVRDLETGEIKKVTTAFLFIGAGGGTLPLLQMSGVPEAKGYGGFPVAGEFLIYTGAPLAAEHLGKVYGQAAVGAPPMSVPHLDTRIINGEKRLIFGPFAGATMKFLKNGSELDLVQSVRPGNFGAMLSAGAQNLELVKYLVAQETLSHKDRIDALREFIPDARADEWKSIDAGVRVQIIKKEKGAASVLKFGTEVVSAADGTLAALLGASPGASTSVSAMLQVLEASFQMKMRSEPWQTKLNQMVPSYGKALAKDPALLQNVRSRSDRTLRLISASCRDLFN